MPIFHYLTITSATECAQTKSGHLLTIKLFSFFFNLAVHLNIQGFLCASVIMCVGPVFY